MFDGVEVTGQVISWAPPLEEDPPLWRLQHEDGDIEDLELFEVEAAAKAFVDRESKTSSRNQEVTDTVAEDVSSSDDEMQIATLRRRK